MSLSSTVAPIVNTPWPVSALTCGSPARLLVRDYDLVSVLPRPEHVRGWLALGLAHQPEHIHCTQERKWLEHPRLEAQSIGRLRLIDHLAVSLYTSSVQYNCREADSRLGLPFLSPTCPGGTLLSRAHRCDYQRPIKAVITPASTSRASAPQRAVASLAITTGHCPLLNVEKIILFTP